MKLLPGALPPIATGSTASPMDRLPLPMAFNASDLLWRYPLGFTSLPSSPLLDYKSQLPNSLASDPRIWSRDDVSTFLRWAEREFDIQPIDMDMFQMNGKAMCLLTRTDLGERAPGSGDVLYNVLQILVREANNLQRLLPSSPVTPTSRHPYPLSPHSNPPTPSWNILTSNGTDSSAFHGAHPASIAAQLMSQSNSVTLSPAPSVDSQNSSPQHNENTPQTAFGQHSIFGSTGSNGSNGSNPSDSDEDEKKWNHSSPPNTPSYANSFNQNMAMVGPQPRSPKENCKFFGREYFPVESPEPNTNGRLLWDFLQQLLNDPQQRYTNHIAWKNRETGVFKIVDPAGLAKLWGIQKNHLSMNYDKMSRALRYYYRVNILRKVQGERHCYQFLRNPSELKNIKNISLLRQQMINTASSASNNSQSSNSNNKTSTSAAQIVPQITIKPEPSLGQITSEVSIKPEPMDMPEVHRSSATSDFDDKPTDLSMEGPTDLSRNSSRHVTNIICSPDPPIVQN